jgi:acetyltransferase-like isoleucine patch superfamily enzyme
MLNFIKRINESLYWRRLYASDQNKWRIEKLKKQGAVIGNDCLIFSMEFSTEPYLIEIGDHVVISSGTQLITHDGAVWLFRDKYPNITVFGRIIIGSNTFIGINCILLPNCEIGSNCVIGAGSTVRGKIEDNSVVMGNPGKVVMKTSIFEKLCINSKKRLDTKNLTDKQRQALLIKNYHPIP